MLQKLEMKGFNKDHIARTVEFLEKSGLINDEILASDLFRFSVERKSLGKNGVKMFLLKRGIGKELIDNMLLDLTSDAEEKSAGEFVERKLRILKNHPENVIRRRLWGMLQRRGFSYDVISRTINSVKL
jgi:regulatory protein